MIDGLALNGMVQLSTVLPLSQSLSSKFFHFTGGLTFNVLHDKVLSPIMGWTRNYHAYIFTNLEDGSMFGCTSSNAIDISWSSEHGYEWIDDQQWNIGIVLYEKGQKLSYVYDLGDRWDHVIIVEDILR